jgi:hypothetical protein
MATEQTEKDAEDGGAFIRRLMPPQGLRKELRFTELTGASCENGIPGGEVVMLIPVWAHSFGDVGWLSRCGC